MSSPGDGKQLRSSVDLWQTQNYWPIKGWSAPMGSTQYQGVTLPGGGVSETFPDNLSPPLGWEWSDKWAIDSSNRFGQPDLEGWFYAGTSDRLSDALRTSSAQGIASKTSLVRRRRWVRPITCTSEVLASKIRERVAYVSAVSQALQQSIEDKEHVMQTLQFYEENRSFVYSQSLHMGTEGTNNTLGILKEIAEKLAVLKEMLQEQSQIEEDYSQRMSALSKKYAFNGTNRDGEASSGNNGEDNSSSISGAADDIGSSTTAPKRERLGSFNESSSLKGDFYQTKTFSNFAPFSSRSTNKAEVASTSSRATGSAVSALASSLNNENSCNDAAVVFFKTHSAFVRQSAARIKEHSHLLSHAQWAVGDLESMLQYAASTLEEAKATFAKNANICRLSESAVQNCFSSVRFAFDTVMACSRRDLELLVEQRMMLNGAAPTDTDRALECGHFNSLCGSEENKATLPRATTLLSTERTGESATTAVAIGQHDGHGVINNSNSAGSGSTTSASGRGHGHREDMWLSIQRYRQCVRDSQEALCVLIAASMDLELLQQILSNKLHSLFANALHSMRDDQLALLSGLTNLVSQPFGTASQLLQAMGPPNAELRSPFDIIQPQLKMIEEKHKKQMAEQQQQHVSRSNSHSPGGSDSSAPSSPLPPPQSPAVQQQQQEFLASAGVFSFTVLYHEPLPPCPAVAYSGHLLMSSNEDFKRSKNVLFDAIWKTVYVIVTSDAYLHIMTGNICDLPDRSFNLKDCDVIRFNAATYPPAIAAATALAVGASTGTAAGSSAASAATASSGTSSGRSSPLPPAAASYDSILEIRPINKPDLKLADRSFRASFSSSAANRRRRAAGRAIEGLYLRAEDESSATRWHKALCNPVAASGVTDESVDQAAMEAMRSSIPIIRGETGEIQLEMQQYMERAEAAKQFDMARGEEDDDEDEDEEGDDENRNGDEGNSKKNAKEKRGPPELTDLEEIDDGGVNLSDDEEEEESPDTNNKRYLPNAQRTSGSGGGAANIKVRPPPPPPGSSTNSGKMLPSPLSAKGTNTFGSQYKKGDGTWINAALNTGPKTGKNGSGPAPRSLIPTSPKDTPLSNKHSMMIKQYQQGLQSEKERAAQRAKESHLGRVKAYAALGSTDEGDDHTGTVSGDSSSSRGITVTTTTSVDGVVSNNATIETSSMKRLGVKKMSMKFDVSAIDSSDVNGPNSSAQRTAAAAAEIAAGRGGGGTPASPSNAQKGKSDSSSNCSSPVTTSNSPAHQQSSP